MLQPSTKEIARFRTLHIFLLHIINVIASITNFGIQKSVDIIIHVVSEQKPVTRATAATGPEPGHTLKSFDVIVTRGF